MVRESASKDESPRATEFGCQVHAWPRAEKSRVRRKAANASARPWTFLGLVRRVVSRLELTAGGWYFDR